MDQGNSPRAGNERRPTGGSDANLAASFIAMEHGEAKGAVTLKTLQRAAEALNRTPVYALVPKEPLEQVVHNRALNVAEERIANVKHTMRLENQPTSAESPDQRVREVAETLVERASSTLWNYR